MRTLQIRDFSEADWPKVWPIVQSIAAAQEGLHFT
jgi:hypothetical protein